MPRISAVLPLCQPVCSSAARICCRSTSLSDPGAEETTAGAAVSPAATTEEEGTPFDTTGAATAGLVTSGGSSESVIRPLFESITARSKQFFNCLTFPGQLYKRKAVTTSSVNSGGVVPAICLSRYAPAVECLRVALAAVED